MSNKKTALIALAGLAAPAGNAVKSIQANAGIRFTLLGRPFVAAFTKTGSGDTQDIAFVIMPEPGSKSEPCTIQELCDGLNGVVSGATGDEQANVFTKEDMDSQIGNYTKGADPETPEENAEISVQLNQLFLYIKKKAGQELDVQYALSVAIAVDDFGLKFKDGKNLVSMDSVWVSIWNTDIESIQKTMQIESIDKLLGLTPEE